VSCDRHGCNIGRITPCAKRYVLKTKLSASLSPCAALPLARLLATEVLIHYKFSAVTIDGKGSRVAEYMCLGIDMLGCTRRRIKMYIGSVTYEP